MFTIKLYTDHGRQIIEEAEKFTVLRSMHLLDPYGHLAEITLHKASGDVRYDIGNMAEREDYWPPLFQKAIIENGAGKTTEIISVPAFNGPALAVAGPQWVSGYVAPVTN